MILNKVFVPAWVFRGYRKLSCLMWPEFQICNNDVFDVFPVNRCGGARVVYHWNKEMINVVHPIGQMLRGKGDVNHKLLE
jgi:hypothetical protein